MATNNPNPAAKPSNIRWAIFVLACSASLILYLQRYTYSLVKPDLAKEWKLTNAQLGLLDGVNSTCYSLFQLPLGIVSDFLGVHIMLTLLMLLGSIGLGLHAWAPDPRYLWYARATFGTGQSAVFANVNRIGKSWYPLSLRTTLQGMAGVFAGRFGGVLAYLLIGALVLGVLAVPWRIVVFFLVGVGILHAVIFFLVFRNSPRKHPKVNEAEAALIDEKPIEAQPAADPPRMNIRQMLRSLKPRALLNLGALNVQSILSTFADNIFSHWIPLIVVQVYAWQKTSVGLFAAVPLLGGAIAGFLGGALNDWLIARTGNRRWVRTIVAGSGKGMAAVLLAIGLFWYEDPYIFCTFLFFVKFFGDWSLTTAWGVITDIGGRATASVFAFNNAVAGIGAIAAGPVIGYLSMRSSPTGPAHIVAQGLGAQTLAPISGPVAPASQLATASQLVESGAFAMQPDWKTVFAVIACVYAACALSWLFINSTIPVVGEGGEEG